MKRLIFVFLICSGTSELYAQDNEDPNLEGHYLGLQVNELVRQILSFNSSGIPSNPYFFNYSYVNDFGEGVNVSFAYTLDKINSSDNFGNDITSNINNVFFRIGYEKRKVLSKRFIYGLGIDLIAESQNNKTFSENNFGSGSTTSKNKISGWGLGPRVSFYYKVSNRILIGTEANYYYKALNEKFDVEFSNNSSNNRTDESKIDRFTFSSPAILWLTFRM
jgi:hypothetical protein